MDRLLALFRRHPPTASLAKERLRIIVAQERSHRGGPDYLPLLRGELLEVIAKYVQVDIERIEIKLEQSDDHDVLELSVPLPQKNAAGVEEHRWSSATGPPSAAWGVAGGLR